MKRKYGLTGLLWICALGSSANLIVNGSFEDPGYASDTHLYASDALTGWTIVSGDMEITSWASADGDQNIELEGNSSNGIIEQTFSAMIGTLYTYSFAYSDNPYYDIADTARVDFMDPSDAVIETQTVTGPGANSTSDVRWQTATGSFTASSTLTTIRFTAMSINGSSTAGVCIDDVSVVPEPASAALLGVAASLILFIRSRFGLFA